MVTNQFEEKTSIFTKSPQFPDIMRAFSDELSQKGRINRLKFFKEKIEPVIPGFSYWRWTDFLKKHEKNGGLAAQKVVAELVDKKVSENLDPNLSPKERSAHEVRRLEEVFATVKTKTQSGIATAIAVGSEALTELLSSPEKLSAEKRAELLFKAMKAQDSRVRAVAEIKKDAREEKVFARVFDESAYLDTD